MGWWEEMVGDLILDENLQPAFALVLAVPLSVVMAALAQLMKRIPAVLLNKEIMPEFLTVLGLVLGFVAAYAFGLPKVITMSAGTMAGALSGRAYDYTRPALEKLGPTGVSK